MDSPLLWAILVPLTVSLGLTGICLACWLAVRRIYLDAERARDLAERVLLLEDEGSSLRRSLKLLNSRAGMRELRERRGRNGAGEEIPDWQTDPEGFRTAARQQYLKPNRGSE